MKVKEVSVTYGRTFTYKPYNSVKLELSFSAEVGEEDSLTASAEELLERARDHVIVELSKFEPRLKEAAAEIVSRWIEKGDLKDGNETEERS